MRRLKLITDYAVIRRTLIPHRSPSLRLTVRQPISISVSVFINLNTGSGTAIITSEIVSMTFPEHQPIVSAVSEALQLAVCNQPKRFPSFTHTIASEFYA